MTTTQLLPWAPLEAVALRWAKARNLHVCENGDDRTVTALAEVLGVTREQVRRWRRGQSLSADVADRVAVGMRMHPASVWHDAWWDLPDVDPYEREPEEQRRERRRERAEFRRVWASIDASVMKALRAAALADSHRLRDECHVGRLGLAS